MVDESDPGLDAASRRQDATDAARFRSDAADLRKEAAHEREQATRLRRMGLAGDADRSTKEADDLETQAANFDHRAELLDDAIAHRKDARLGYDIADKADAAAAAAHTAAGKAHDALEKGTEDLDVYVQLRGDEAAARAREDAMRKLAEGTREGSKAELEHVVLEEEKEARAGLPGRNVQEIEGMPPIVDPWATPGPSAVGAPPTDAAGAPTTDATIDPWIPATADPSGPEG